MDVLYLTPVAYEAAAIQWFCIGLTSGIACGMILSVLMRWMTDTHN